ncbi:MAG: tetratricopeptide repeat protein [Flavobacteriales bacterium]
MAVGKIVSLLSFLFFFSFHLFSQRSSPSSGKFEEREFERYKGIYEKAMTLNDFNVATMACYEMISLMPLRKDLNDTLAMLYYAQNAYQQAAIIADDVLKINPDNRNIRELSAMSFDQIGDLERALSQYTELYRRFGELYYLYKCASIEFLLKNFERSENHLNALIQNPLAQKQTITMALNAQTAETQQILLSAAAYNIKGVIAMESQKFTEAKANFDKALELSPGFRNAQNNLENLRKKQNPPLKSP